ncbi:hypothetical protein Tco_0017462 [Tanacetum coccineum]
MSTLTFADTHNMVTFLEKPAESDGFHEIIDFLNANQIRYALTVNPTIYTSCIEQFWATAKAKTVNGERQIQALIDKKKVIITETSIRSDLHLEDAGGTDCLPTATIFKELARMGSHKKRSRRKQRKTTTVTTGRIHNKKTVLDLEKAKDAQAKEIADLKKRVQKLKRNKKSRTTGLKRLRKVGKSRRVESSEDKDSLCDHEDASKQGRSIEDVDKDADVSLVDDTQGVGEKQEHSAKEREINTSVEDSAAPTTIEEITLAQTLIQIKAAKPKVVTTAATTTTTRPKARGVVVQEAQIKLLLIKICKKSINLGLGGGREAELIEEERLARKKEEEANIALIESWDNTQAMIEADFELAQRLQTEEQGEITIEERSRLFVELMNKRKKHFAMLRAEEKRRKPPTKAQKRNLMSTYLKNMGGYKHNQLKSKSYEEIQKLFDNEMRRVNTFIPMDSEVVKSKKETEESSKGTEDELESDKSKKAESSEEKAKGSRKRILLMFINTAGTKVYDVELQLLEDLLLSRG